MDKPTSAIPASAQVEKTDRLQRFRRLNRFLPKIVPYGFGVAILSRATRNPLMQSLLGVHWQRLRTFLEENHLAFDARQIRASCLTTNWLTIWRLSALARCSEPVFGRWVSVQGYDAFRQLREQGRPVILCNSHYGAGKMILMTLLRFGHDIHSLDRFDLFSFFDIRTKGKLISINLGDRQSNFMLKQVFRARKVLQEGGILHIAGDGTRGLSGRAIPFFRRQRQFPASVAELALATNAAVVPIFGVLEVDGRVRIELLPPLEMPDEQLPHDERVMHIIGQYGKLMQDYWRASPGSIWKSELKIYTELPIPENSGEIRKV